jgi:hypothetical protein
VLKIALNGGRIGWNLCGCEFGGPDHNGLRFRPANLDLAKAISMSMGMRYASSVLLAMIWVASAGAAFAQGTQQAPYSGAPSGVVVVPGRTVSTPPNSTPNRPTNYFSPADPSFVGPNATGCCGPVPRSGRR